MSIFPIESILPQLHNTLKSQNRVLIVAPPGAGKSTVLPLSLLEQINTDDASEIWLLEPRRVAAEQVARRLAISLNEELGHSIGLVTGDFSKTSKQNRLVVMTEGILVQRLLQDNDISRCKTIIFDEFHERSLPSDLGLALATQCQEYLREDLNILIMSATLDSATLVDKLNAVLIESQGRSYPVDVHYRAKKTELSLESNMAKLIQTAWGNHAGDILVFLPGMKEISKTRQSLESSFSADISQNSIILPMHGQLPNLEQKKVLQANDKRKIILATDIAKTSLTIEGVTVVVDSCLERQARFNLQNAMDELITVQASQASMVQRAGRAGRTQAGHCYRLTSSEAYINHSAFSQSAIQLSDLTPFSLTLGAWGSFDLDDFLLLDKPDAQRYQNSLSLLSQLDGIKTNNNEFSELTTSNNPMLTDHGRSLSEFSIHPRLAHMLLSIDKSEWIYSACFVAAIMTEGDPLYFQDQNSDLSIRLELFKQYLCNNNIPKSFDSGQVKYNLATRIIKLAKRLAKKLNVKEFEISSEASGILCMLA